MWGLGALEDILFIESLKTISLTRKNLDSHLWTKVMALWSVPICLYDIGNTAKLVYVGLGITQLYFICIGKIKTKTLNKLRVLHHRLLSAPLAPSSSADQPSAGPSWSAVVLIFSPSPPPKKSTIDSTRLSLSYILSINPYLKLHGQK